MPYSISVIIPLYNVEKYISKCLDSVVNQTLGIDNIEVIIVNDCSQDSSMETVERYAQKHPSFKVINQEFNQGPGAARNKGLQHSTAPYITFLDADDFISLNTFEYALNKFKKFDCDLVLYEYEYYSESNKKYARNPSAALYRSNRLETDITKIPEIIFSGFVCNRVFKRTLFNYLVFPEERMGAFEDTMVATLTTFESRSIYISSECKYFYRKREDQTNKSRMDSMFVNKELYFNHMEVSWKMNDLCQKYPQYRELLYWYNARGLTPFLFHMLFNKDFTRSERLALFQKGKEILAQIPENIVDKVDNEYSKLIIRKLQRNGYIGYVSSVYYKWISNQGKKVPNFIRVRFLKLVKGVELLFITLVALLLKNKTKYKDMWLVCERGDDAGDNGYHFFKYLREYHPSVNAYYLIDKKQKDYEKIKSLGNVIQYKSLRHKLSFILSSVLIGAHKGKIEPWNYDIFLKLTGKLIPQKKYVFLQHGITKDDVSDILGKENTPFDLFITAAKPETDYIIKKFGYHPSEVACTGFARFDALHERESQKQILFMPTYRLNVVQPSWRTEMVPDNVFIESDFYFKLNSFINNDKLIQLLKDNEYKLIFYPHYEVQQYLHYFNTSSKDIVIASKEEYDVQQLLKESQLLITDFSSVFFDFAYMEKPVLYYQFDKETFFREHYRKGYYDYETHGFGPVFTQETEVVDEIEKIIESNFMMEERYLSRLNNFYGLRDKNNNARIFQAIKKIGREVRGLG